MLIFKSYAITFGECNGACKVTNSFSETQFGSWKYLRNRSNKNDLYLSRGYSQSIFNQTKRKKEIFVRTGVES